MKSNKKQLENRGMIDDIIIDKVNQLSYDELIEGLRSSPQYRSACIRLLALKYHTKPEFTSILLNLLQKEKALYTKIEIQNQLSVYGNIAKMCQYLGVIGTNQYKTIPMRSSLKKSYPLPRDIIARSLANISMERFDQFYSLLPTLTVSQFQEAIDALGYLCFYHRQIITDEMYAFILDCFTKHQDNQLITWKLITCLSSFHMSYDFLLTVKKTQKHPTILEEVERSLKLIERLNNH